MPMPRRERSASWSPAMEATSRGGYLADCHVKLPCKSRCVTLSRKIIKTMFSAASEDIGG